VILSLVFLFLHSDKETNKTENNKSIFSEKYEVNFDINKYPAPSDKRDKENVPDDVCVACAGGEHYIAYYKGVYSNNQNTTIAYDKYSSCGCGKYWEKDGYFVYVNENFKKVSEKGLIEYIKLYNSSCNGCLEKYAFYGD